MDILNNGALILSGTVGRDYFDEGFAYTDVIMALAQVQGDVTVRLNSGGGIATEGVAIYNALAQHKGKITVHIEGIAASAASIIAMAGDEIIMGKGAMMMIHDPLVYAAGNADDMSKVIEMLNAMGNAMASIYSEKTGRASEEIREEMREEIWMTAEEAVAKGYADRVVEADAQTLAAFDYRVYAKAPVQILAVSDERKWSNRLKATAPKVTEQETETMTTKKDEPGSAPAVTPEAAAKAEQDRAMAIMDLCFKAEVPALAAGFVRDGLSVEEATARVKAEAARVSAIKAKVEAARKTQPMIDASLADVYAASGMSPEAVGDDLLNRINTMSATAPQRGSHNATPASDQGQVTASWDKIVANINSQRGLSA